jgi:hypothetical protein
VGGKPLGLHVGPQCTDWDICSTGWRFGMEVGGKSSEWLIL